MGRKKSKRSRKSIKKVTRTLECVFDCPFCSNEKSCVAILIAETATGKISCSECREEFQTPINHLSAPIDVYNEWIDACEAANN